MLYCSTAQGSDADAVLAAAVRDVHDQAVADDCEIVQVAHDVAMLTMKRPTRDATRWKAGHADAILVTVTAVGTPNPNGPGRVQSRE